MDFTRSSSLWQRRVVNRRLRISQSSPCNWRCPGPCASVSTSRDIVALSVDVRQSISSEVEREKLKVGASEQEEGRPGVYALPLRRSGTGIPLSHPAGCPHDRVVDEHFCADRPQESLHAGDQVSLALVLGHEGARPCGVYLMKGRANGMPDSLAYPMAWAMPESGMPQPPRAASSLFASSFPRTRSACSPTLDSSYWM